MKGVCEECGLPYDECSRNAFARMGFEPPSEPVSREQAERAAADVLAALEWLKACSSNEGQK